MISSEIKYHYFSWMPFKPSYTNNQTQWLARLFYRIHIFILSIKVSLISIRIVRYRYIMIYDRLLHTQFCLFRLRTFICKLFSTIWKEFFFHTTIMLFISDHIYLLSNKYFRDGNPTNFRAAFWFSLRIRQKKGLIREFGFFEYFADLRFSDFRF